MSTLTKILLIIGSVLIILTLGFIVFEQFEMKKKQDTINDQVIASKQLNDNILRNQNNVVTPDQLQKMITDNKVDLSTIQDDMKKMNTQLEALSTVTVNSQGQTYTNVGSTSVVQIPISSLPKPDPSNPDPYHYLTTQQNLSLFEKFGTVSVPIGSVGFSGDSKTPWNETILPRQYNVDTVIAHDKNGRLSTYNKFRITVDGKDYPLTIADGKLSQTEPPNTWSWWNPKFFIFGGGSAVFSKPVSASANFGGGLQVMSFGKYLSNPLLSVLQIGGEFSTNNTSFSAVINPISVNIGQVLGTSWINNTYIGPSLHVEVPSGKVGLGLNLSVGL